MKKKRIIINSLLLIFTFIIGITVIYPEISKNKSEINNVSFDTIKADIFKSAEDKYNSDTKVLDSEYKVYKVSDLIKEGYITKKSIKDGYDENSKVLVINENGKIKYYYINGDTLLNKIRNNDIKQNEDGLYLFKGDSLNNYVSFNQEIYRLIMIDEKSSAYIIKDICSDNIKKSNIDEYLSSYYNDKYNKEAKKLIDGKLSIIDSETYNKTMQDNETYIKSQKDMWIKDNDEYKIMATDTSEIIDSKDSDKACVKLYIKLKNIAFVEKGNGTQFDPYILSTQIIE